MHQESAPAFETPIICERRTIMADATTQSQLSRRRRLLAHESQDSNTACDDSSIDDFDFGTVDVSGKHSDGNLTSSSGGPPFQKTDSTAYHQDNSQACVSDSETDASSKRTKSSKSNKSADGRESPSALLGSYFQQMGEMRRGAMEKLYETTVDGPCRNTCQALVSCEHSLEEQIRGMQDATTGGVSGHHSNSSAHNYDHTSPRKCEYCHFTVCQQDCERPNFYFLNKKPPFANSDDDGEWDENDYPIDKIQNLPSKQGGPNDSWVSGFF